MDDLERLMAIERLCERVLSQQQSSPDDAVSALQEGLIDIEIAPPPSASSVECTGILNGRRDIESRLIGSSLPYSL